MRVSRSLKTYILGSLFYGWDVPDRPRVFYYQTKSYLNRFLLKRKPSDRVVSVKAGKGTVHFRDNWFDPRNICDVFKNDYNKIDADIFKGLKTFADIGSNIGLISACVRRESPGCRIFCFEPLPDNANLCTMNAPGATVETVALGSKDGTANLLVDRSGFMASSIRFGYEQKANEVKMFTLDGYFQGNPVGFDLIKIDVEGMEVEVILGGKRTVTGAKRVIAEVHSDELLSRFRDLMGSYGFRENSIERVENNIYISDWLNTKRQ